MVKFFYTKLFKEKKKTRGFAILLAYLVAILLFVLLAWLVIPQIVDSIAMLFTNFPSYIQSIQDMLGMVQERFGVDLSSATKVLDDSEAMVKEIYSMASAAMPQIVASIGSVASNFVAIFTSIAASIYMLADKEHLLHQLRTLAHAFLPEKAAENTLRICHYANVNFTGFFVGKIIDSAIIGVITFVAMAILRLDFALLISVFIGITNIIPVFGPFIGAIPSIFILLLVDPIQAVIFGVLILVIQQVDGNFIGPKILARPSASLPCGSCFPSWSAATCSVLWAWSSACRSLRPSTAWRRNLCTICWTSAGWTARVTTLVKWWRMRRTCLSDARGERAV